MFRLAYVGEEKPEWKETRDTRAWMEFKKPPVRFELARSGTGAPSEPPSGETSEAEDERRVFLVHIKVGDGEAAYDYLYFGGQVGEESECCERYRGYQIGVEWRHKTSSRLSGDVIEVVGEPWRSLGAWCWTV